MPEDFNLPELGEGIDGGDVIELLVKEGDRVEEGQPMFELETAKATIPVPAPRSGRIARVHFKVGDHITVGQTLVTLDHAASDVPTSDNERARPEATTKPKHVEVKESKRPAQAESPPRQETRAEQRTTPSAGAESPSKPEGGGHQARLEPREDHAQGSGRAWVASNDPVAAGPASRRLARELGVDIHRVTGSGSGGRITEDDIKAYVRRTGVGSELSVPDTQAAAPKLADFSRWGPVERVQLSAVRRATAEHTSLAWKAIPHVTHFDDADISQFEQFRTRHAEQHVKNEIKLTVTAIAIKAAALSLKEFPQFNATLDPAANELILKRYYHIGVAVDTERGLIVPVIRDVDKKSLSDIAIELLKIADRAKDKRTTLEEMQGGTFTITNVGSIGGRSFTPIIHYPEVAILGLARAREHQIVHDGRTVTRLLLPLCLSFDHRAIDGAEAARFCRHVAQLLENPYLMLLKC